eukprot:CAMPEP_0197055110 /NCGR_PEP_ID=MMETSP1384-20130603/57794_1 /TAXON_ID=29189 /ORGANISM="Ammonia sp." /LENGTH=206 /DNA_ID=CAMNT_0042488565 /DNA_START=9 /DNA_END=629 /DNA_ORIENTATION=+
MATLMLRFLQSSRSSISTKLKISEMNAFLRRYPWASGAVITCGKTIVADLIVQSFVDKKKWNEIDWIRVSVFGTFGLCYLGTFQFWLYNIMYFRMFPGRELFPTAKKVFFDQFIKSPVLYWPCFYSIKITLNERKLDADTWSILKNTYTTNLYKDCREMWKIWIPSHMLMFALIPFHLRLPYNAFVSLIWCCILSAMHGKYEKEKQ